MPTFCSYVPNGQRKSKLNRARLSSTFFLPVMHILQGKTNPYNIRKLSFFDQSVKNRQQFCAYCFMLYSDKMS